MGSNITGNDIQRVIAARVYALPIVREVPPPPADAGTTGTW